MKYSFDMSDKRLNYEKLSLLDIVSSETGPGVMDFPVNITAEYCPGRILT